MFHQVDGLIGQAYREAVDNERIRKAVDAIRNWRTRGTSEELKQMNAALERVHPSFRGIALDLEHVRHRRDLERERAHGKGKRSYW